MASNQISNIEVIVLDSSESENSPASNDMEISESLFTYSCATECDICRGRFPRIDLTQDHPSSLARWEHLANHNCVQDVLVVNDHDEKKVDETAEINVQDQEPTDDSYIDWAERISIMGSEVVNEFWRFQQLYCNCIDDDVPVISCPVCGRNLPCYDLTNDSVVRLECLCNHECILFRR